jgi:hypothetical protein
MKQRGQKKEGTGGTIGGKDIIYEEKRERKLRRTAAHADLTQLLLYVVMPNGLRLQNEVCFLAWKV